MPIRWVCVLMAAWLTGCAVPPPLLDQVSEYTPDGSVVGRTKMELSDFEQLAGNWAPRTSGKAGGAAVDEIFTMEADVPDGLGDAGGYLVVYRSGKVAELRYFEQRNHEPRVDRYYHRTLKAAELAELQQFVATHPPAELSQSHAAATQPADGGGRGAEQGGGGSGVVFRWMDARARQAYAVTMPGLTLDAHPGGDLVLLLVKLRDAEPLVCQYMIRVPTTARLLYGSPFKEVRKVWVSPDGTDVRAEIFPPLELAPGVPADSTAERWYACRAGVWSPCDLPPPPPPAPASTLPPAPETVPATGPAASRFSASQLMPTHESWLVEPMDGFTRVRHIVPENAFTAQIRNFDVPGLVFDEAHMVVSGKQMYLIHSGHLFALDLPEAAWVQP